MQTEQRTASELADHSRIQELLRRIINQTTRAASKNGAKPLVGTPKPDVNHVYELWMSVRQKLITNSES